MNKKIILLFVLMIFVVGCNPKTAVTTEVDIRQGTEGLFIEPVDNAPPSKIPEQTEFPFIIKLENKGAYDIEEGFISISLETGFLNYVQTWEIDRNLIESSQKAFSFFLKGKSVDSPYGEQALAVTKIKSGSLEKLSTNHPSTILMNTCYDYGTRATATICIDPDPWNLKQLPKACQSQKVNLGTQGAPVAVKSVEPQVTPKGDRIELKLRMELVNSGKGKVVNKGLLEGFCKGTLSEQDSLNAANVIDIVSMSLGTETGQFVCVPEVRMFPGKVRLSKSNVITCTYDQLINAASAYTTPFNINIEYGYTDSEIRHVIIEKQGFMPR